MNVFELRNSLVSEYGSYTQSFIAIRDAALRSRVQERIDQGELWPDPLLQLNPSYESGGSIDELVANQVLHRECARIFRRKRDGGDDGTPLQLYRHQVDAISVAARGEPFVVTTGTGSGKSLTYIIPIVDHVLRRGSGRGIQAIVIYPMNALANSQFDELGKYLQRGYPDGAPPVSFARYTGQEPAAERRRIIESPPDILLTNYVMLELLLTRRDERTLINSARDLRYLVLDELHTYRGRQGADVAMLVRRCRQAFSEDRLICVGTSATMATDGSRSERRRMIADVATSIFGQGVGPDQIIDETLTRTTVPRDFGRDADRRELAQAVTELAAGPASGVVPFDSLVSSPLAAWIEDAFGLATDPESTRLRRARPRPVAGPGGASSSLADLTGLPLASCEAAIRAALELGSRVRHPLTGLPVFAFRLHQFVTRGDTVWASLEPPGQWHIALRGQKFVPGDRTRILLPAVSTGHRNT